MPQAPYDADDYRSRGLAEWCQAGYEVSPPAELFTQGEQQTGQGSQAEGLDDAEYEQELWGDRRSWRQERRSVEVPALIVRESFQCRACDDDQRWDEVGRDIPAESAQRPPAEATQRKVPRETYDDRGDGRPEHAGVADDDEGQAERGQPDEACPADRERDQDEASRGNPVDLTSGSSQPITS